MATRSVVPRSLIRPIVRREARGPVIALLHRYPGSQSSSFLSTAAGTTPDDDATKNAGAKIDSADAVVYESPLANLVTRLRTVSLATGICGTLGLPLAVAAKGGDLPSTGLLAFGMAFVTGSLGSTAAIHFVFSPYVYTIERIPVRLCHYKGKVGEGAQQGHDTSEPSIPAEANQEGATRQGELTASSSSSVPKDFLYRAVSRSLFLTRIETVFNPETDVTAYKGLKPLCNFVVKGRPLYVHPEYLYNAQLRLSMKLTSKVTKGASDTKENPDDFL